MGTHPSDEDKWSLPNDQERLIQDAKDPTSGNPTPHCMSFLLTFFVYVAQSERRGCPSQSRSCRPAVPPATFHCQHRTPGSFFSPSSRYADGKTDPSCGGRKRLTEYFIGTEGRRGWMLYGSAIPISQICLYLRTSSSSGWLCTG